MDFLRRGAQDEPMIGQRDVRCR